MAWESTADGAVCVSRPRYVAVFELRGVAHRERVGVLGAEHLERGLVDLADGDDAGATDGSPPVTRRACVVRRVFLDLVRQIPCPFVQ
jgi:hypothetical protein